MKGVISGSPAVGRKASSWRGVLMRGVVARRARSAVLLVAACDAGMARSVVRIALRRSGLVGGVDNGVFRRDMSVMSWWGTNLLQQCGFAKSGAYQVGCGVVAPVAARC